MNSNTIHNVGNALILVLGALGALATWAGCTALPTGAYDCSASQIIPGSWLPIIVSVTGALGAIKLIMNLMRDGLGGLFKVQPPVSDSIHTVVVPTGHGEKLDVKRVNRSK